MNDRDFKLLVREYFQARGRAEFAKDRLTLNQSVLKAAESEKKILSELERFTQQEQEELPFKD